MVHSVAVAVRQLVLAVLVIVVLYPLLFMLETALKTNQGYITNPTGFPVHPTLSTFGLLLTSVPVGRWMLNSAGVTAVSVFVATAIALFTAYALVYSRGRARGMFLNLNIAFIAIPPVALLVPMFVLMVRIGLINTLPAVMIFYVGLLVPFSVFFCVRFLQEVPGELVDAASVDGSPAWRTLVTIVLPLAAPAVVTLVIINSIAIWNELLIALVFLQSDSTRTLMAGLTTVQGRYSENEPLVMAGAVLSMLPMLLLYVGAQRFFVRGLTTGMGK
jgi:raffinose/stachyose/melibiose transport system permease protein